ncbi:hypothetical protein BJX68DRAFT_266720 [Aspergillus pseudodeflectus]|uniref:LITAF domain-containing protein n=1 Tax=Aspergillus pseudodeflectus TaxID=176178 RepID=A0ABR4KE20_9EURO
MPELHYRDSDSTTSADSSTLHEMNSLPRSFTGYAAVPQNDLTGEEKLQQQQQGHGHRYLAGFNSNPLPSEASFQSHTHCEACDAFLERQHKRRFAILLAWIAAIMFVASLIFGLVLGIVVVNAKKDSPYYH